MRVISQPYGTPNARANVHYFFYSDATEFKFNKKNMSLSSPITITKIMSQKTFHFPALTHGPPVPKYAPFGAALFFSFEKKTKTQWRMQEPEIYVTFQ